MEELERGSLSVRASNDGPDLRVLLTLSPPPGEEAHVTNISLTSAAVPSPGLGVRPVLPPGDVRPVGTRGGGIGFGFLYSTGDTERYVRRHSDRGYGGPESSGHPQRLEARWTLTGLWAEARELDLMVEVVTSLFPNREQRRGEAHFVLVRPKEQVPEVQELELGAGEQDGPRSPSH